MAIENSYESMFGDREDALPDFIPQMMHPELNERLIDSALEKAKKENKWLLVFVIGTKPCFYKFYGSIVEARKRDIPFIIMDSNQHYDATLTHGLKEFNYLDKVAFKLNIRGGLAQKSAELMLKVKWAAELLKKKAPEVTAVPVVLGDTILTSIVPAAWMFTRDEKAIQNEAGLRSMTPKVMYNANEVGKTLSAEEFAGKQFNGEWELLTNEPFPEQWDSFVSAKGAEYMFAPLELNKEHLIREGHVKDNIFITGGVVVEALDVKRKEKSEKSIFDIYPQLEQGEWLRVDIHRRGNLTPRRFTSIIAGIKELIEKGHNVSFIEMNATKHAIEHLNLNQEIDKLKKHKNFLYTPIWPEYAHVIEFFESKNCFSVLTDSGGVQEEMNIIGKPCLTCRLNTDRPETVNLAKSNLLVPPVSKEAIFSMVDYVFNNDNLRKTMSSSGNIYGSDVAKKMMSHIIDIMNSKDKPFKWCHDQLRLWNDERESTYK